jgi:ABC-type transport system substrate-binding protein
MVKEVSISKAIVGFIIGLIVVGSVCYYSGNNIGWNEGYNRGYEDGKGAIVLPAKYGGTLTVGIGADAIRLDPIDQTDNPSEMVCRHIYEGLVEFDENLDIRPCLAHSWEISKDGCTYTFYLEHGVLFHDGSPFNAEAVKFNVERWLKGCEPENRTWRRTALYAPYIKSVDVVDQYTVQIKLFNPFGAFLHHLAHGAALMVSPAAVEKYGETGIATNPVGTGPFKFVEWVKDDHITLDANLNYWKGRPFLDRLIFKVAPEGSARVMMLEAGDAQLIERVPSTEISRLQTTSGIDVYIRASLRTIYLGMNCKKEPFNNTKVRQAVNYAIDKEKVCKQILSGMGDPSDSPLAPLTWGYYSTGGYPYDPEKAKQLLAEAGYPNGFKATLWTPKGRYLMDYEVAQAVQGQLKEVGIDLELRTWEWASYIGALDLGPEKGEYQMFLLGWAPSTGDADWVLRPLFSTELIAPAGDNYAGYSNPVVDDYIKAGMTAASIDERYEAYKNAQIVIVNEAPWAFLYVMKQTVAAKSNVHGVQILPIEILIAKNAWIEK